MPGLRFYRKCRLQCSLIIKKRGIKALLDGTIVVKQKKAVRVRKGSRPQIGQGLPESKRASMDVGSIMGGPVVHGQEATVRRTAGIPRRVLVTACESRSPHINRFLRLDGG